jgi:DNA-binding response OmpR family regulator
MDTKTTVLVIDDEKKIVEIVKSFLENDGYRALTKSKQYSTIFS